jgi:aminobenzoyl-glutamate transport protein
MAIAKPKAYPPETEAQPAPRAPFVFRALERIERAGNVLPHPATLFVIFSALLLVVSAAAAQAGLSVTHPGTGETVHAVSLVSVEGMHRILTSLVTNFTGFAPLGLVLVSMLGIAVAEASGLISALMRALVLAAPKRLLTAAVVFVGVNANVAGDVGIVLLPPLAAMIFLAVGRHPLAGLAAAYAGVSGTLAADLLIGPFEPLIAGLTQEAAHIVDASYAVTPAANYYFMAVSAFVLTAAGVWVTERIVVPRLGEYAGDEKPESLDPLSPLERRGLWWAGAAFALFAAFLLAGTVPESGFLRDPQTGSLLKSPFMTGLVALIFFGAVAIGLAYGVGARTVRRDADVVRGMEKSMETMAVYIVLAFFAAQFIALFNWSNLGLITAVKGADALRSIGFGGIPLLVAFVVFSIALDMAIGSASAKWAFMAPIFVPMFMLLGLSPETTQAAYRVGDSVCNIVTPMGAYFPLILAYAQRYEKRCGMGTILALMIPYSITFFVLWTVFLIVWFVAGAPLGPGAGLHYAPGAP